ncbi:universal stress protein [Maribacter sp. MMG018]|uniref:universal stress protein n=1 Tax=Maribacter sp. MMG018 TaxID=2822688 RepID=UPI001B380AB8|nr:universal stress protein [Maribacter sp. MMG018]MBQ4915935.1 universal stress protein [Maribacter sp. MMG018]
MKNLLIPTDFSSNAAHAISYALDLFKCERANFYFLHTYADEVYEVTHNVEDSFFDKQKKAIALNSKKLLDEIITEQKEKRHNPRHHYEAVATFDSLVDGVNSFINIKNIDLTIMGTKGKTADKKVTFGSHTVQVFKYVNCPVLAVPDLYPYSPPKKILFPTDYMVPYKRRELKLLDMLAARYKSEVHALYISDFEDLSHRQLDNKKFLEATLPNAIIHSKRTSVKNKAEAIMEYMDLNQMNLLTMVNSRHSFLEDMLYRSTVDQIALHTPIPFLVLQNLPR